MTVVNDRSFLGLTLSNIKKELCEINDFISPVQCNSVTGSEDFAVSCLGNHRTSQVNVCDIEAGNAVNFLPFGHTSVLFLCCSVCYNTYKADMIAEEIARSPYPGHIPVPIFAVPRGGIFPPDPRSKALYGKGKIKAIPHNLLRMDHEVLPLIF